MMTSSLTMSSMILPVAILQCVYFASARQQCDAPKFSCQFNDPCDPLCVADQYVYPGKSDRVYVECVEGACAEHKCPRRTIWNQANQRCEGKGNGLETRCAYGKFDCEARNPCTPTLCTSGVDNYPGPSPRWYVSCTDGCSREQCPRRQVWDQEKQRCVRKSTVCPDGQSFDEVMSQCVEAVVCNWQEITVPTPADDCTNEYAFHRLSYVDRERGYRHLDGFVDCEASPEGNRFYVEEYGIIPPRQVMAMSCFASDGLCLPLTTIADDGSNLAPLDNVYNVLGSFNFTFNNLQNEVHSTCVKMNYFDERPKHDFTQEIRNECYDKGGGFLLQRIFTHSGSCSAKIPCSVTSAEDTIIYEHVCA